MLKNANKRRKLAMAVGLICIVIILMLLIIFYLLPVYNQRYGHFCNNDQDCTWKCGAGAVNRYYVFLDFGRFVCIASTQYVVCENNLCQKFKREHANVDFCQRRDFGKTRDVCYWDLAVNLKDTKYCEYIGEEGTREICKTLIPLGH